MIVIGGSASSNLAKDLAKQLNGEYVQAVTKTFPDGETYARIEREALRGEVVIVQNSYP
ncbi:MAG: ribose-phosphate pyrophosphokinase-like domain-containing protein, partial [Methanomassiliicoccales archaeon]|nr:ribose-phosphate pyrophosphokinase-like domain-containing protein [Methanomassiliicoccales archaeon]